ncbi:adenine deaminase [Dolichospermum sp. LEGE 00246]|jgi:adenine deaminase|uniref:adenine deaminase n=2 Tax=Dolichospermum TaxID=748770 RepID=UPI001880D35B|nr:adenine deaminase [Dolichospermum sp. LEGE 00246]MBE9259614.1 adenine deaminase [Dolichospermum sp. LEGE 00246]MDK2409898.1 adenine deaminase [Aphanizomenon sp. 202]MDK2460863.1 adenine deaminase [Aphanizomenon sp. PH219]
MNNLTLSGNIVDVLHRRIFPGTIHITDGRIQTIVQDQGQYSQYILPGFIDAHVHIESSMLVPTEFARLATVHGTVATVSDPHEIANVLGLEGVEFMVDNAAQTPLKIAFGFPACVPATEFETAGAKLTVNDFRQLVKHGISYLSEVMNVPGVLADSPEMMDKIHLAQSLGLPIDGHAPGLSSTGLRKYATQITTDHECSTLNEALEKLALGMKIQIREGSAAKNFDALHSLIDSHAADCMFCSDDKHPDDLVTGHINLLVKRAVALGHDVMNILEIACVNPVKHYNLDVGLLQIGDSADLIVVDNLQDFTVLATYCQGILTAKTGSTLLPFVPVKPINKFITTSKTPGDFAITAKGATVATVRVITVTDGQLITGEKCVPAHIENGEVIADLNADILKITVVNRYQDTPPTVALVQNFGLKRGAIASSVAHDSHNIVAVGTSDAEICAAVNAVISHQGGIAVAEDNVVHVLPLPVAGLMSDSDGYEVAKQYAELDNWAKQLGSKLTAPFMTLSFMALLVIPDLKLSDRGLFSGKEFRFVSLWID